MYIRTSEFVSFKRIQYSTIPIVVVCFPHDLDNGRVNYNQTIPSASVYYVGTMASFTCNDGYSVSASESSICQSSGNWSQQALTCGNEINMYCFLYSQFSEKCDQNCPE